MAYMYGMFPSEFWSLEPREVTAWVLGRQKHEDIQARNRVEVMKVIRWGFGFLANFWSKKAVKVEQYLSLPYDKKEKVQVIKKDDFESLAKKFDDSANNR